MNSIAAPITTQTDQFTRPLDTSRPTLSFGRESESQLSRYLAVLRRRKWIVLACIALGVLGALFLTLSTTRLYRATTTLEVLREVPKVVNVEDVAPPQALGTEFYETQYGLIKSRSVAAQAVRRLRLADNAAFLTGYDGGDPAPVMGQPRQAREQRAIGLVQAHTVVTPVRNSGLVGVSFDSPNPELSANVANAIAAAYIASNLQRRYDASGYARDFLQKELGKVRGRLETSERQAVDYAQAQQLLEINRKTDPQGNTSGESLSEIDLDVLNRALAQARADRIDAEAKYSAARSTGASAEALTDATLAPLRVQLSQLQAEYARNATTLKPDYPTQQALRQQISALQAAIGRQGGTIGSTLQSAYQAASTREQALANRVQQLKNQVTDQNRRRIQYNIYQRDADTNRVLYDSLLNRYKEVGIAGGVGTNNVSVVDAARAPGGPYSPNALANLLLGFLVGFLAGVAAAFIIDQLDDAVKTPADLESMLGLPLLGVIPRIAAENPIEELADRRSVMSDAYLAVQTSLGFSTPEGVPAVMSITSANAAEGKSTTAVAIATSLARLGRSVLLIDADMRNPSLHQLINHGNEHGLVELLTGNARLSEVVAPTEVEHLSAVTAGPIPPNPVELLSSPRLRELLDEARRRFSHVIVDAPPVLGLADAPLIASAADATVFVIAANSTSSRSSIGSLKRLADAHAHIIGAVLTKYRASEHGYGYNYTYSYGSKSATPA